jgi:hypothetical protein
MPELGERFRCCVSMRRAIVSLLRDKDSISSALSLPCQPFRNAVPPSFVLDNTCHCTVSEGARGGPLHGLDSAQWAQPCWKGEGDGGCLTQVDVHPDQHRSLSKAMRCLVWFDRAGDVFGAGRDADRHPCSRHCRDLRPKSRVRQAQRRAATRHGWHRHHASCPLAGSSLRQGLSQHAL